MQSPFNGNSLRLTFPKDSPPENLTFVLRQSDPEQWYNCGGGDFRVPVAGSGKPGGSRCACAATPVHSDTGAQLQ